MLCMLCRGRVVVRHKAWCRSRMVVLALAMPNRQIAWILVLCLVRHNNVLHACAMPLVMRTLIAVSHAVAEKHGGAGEHLQ